MNKQLHSDAKHQPPSDPSSGDTPAGGNLEEARQQNAAFLKAANDIISAALSNDSQAFLDANRQHGGQ